MLCNHSELINRAIDAYFFFYSGSSRSTFSKRQPWQLQLCRIECHSVCLRQYKVAEKSNVASSGYSESFQPLSKSKKTNSCTDRSYSNFSSVFFFFSFSFISLWSALSCFKWHGEQEMCVCVSETLWVCASICFALKCMCPACLTGTGTSTHITQPIEHSIEVRRRTRKKTKLTHIRNSSIIVFLAKKKKKRSYWTPRSFGSLLASNS